MDAWEAVARAVEYSPVAAMSIMVVRRIGPIAQAVAYVHWRCTMTRLYKDACRRALDKSEDLAERLLAREMANDINAKLQAGRKGWLDETGGDDLESGTP